MRSDSTEYYQESEKVVEETSNFISKDLKTVEKKIEKLKKSAEVNYRTSLKEEVGEEYLDIDVGECLKELNVDFEKHFTDIMAFM